jgi:hypothetical protein
LCAKYDISMQRFLKSGTRRNAYRQTTDAYWKARKIYLTLRLNQSVKIPENLFYREKILNLCGAGIPQLT